MSKRILIVLPLLMTCLSLVGNNTALAKSADSPEKKVPGTFCSQHPTGRSGKRYRVPFSQNSSKPNIIFIMADDLGYRELGSFGQTKIKTPHLDKLAEQGVRLTQHYAGNAVCAPSRCVLMTAQHPGHAWIRSNLEIKPEGQEPIPANVITMAEALKKQGYTTGAFGKWGLGAPGSEGDPMNQGFDRFFGYNCQRHAHSYYPGYLWDNDRRIPLNNDPPIPGHAKWPKGQKVDKTDPRSYDQFKGNDYASDRIYEQVLDFVKTNRDKPFFLYYPTIIPHLALHVPDEELKPYLELGWNDPPFTKPNGGYTPHYTPRAAYAAMISRLDRYVGNLMKLLDELGLAENTIVVFTSDNGATYASEVDTDFFNSVGELRGRKAELYEGGIRVPAIVRWPDHIAANIKSDRVTGFEDWMPTLMEMINTPDATPKNTDGISFAPTLLGKTQTPRPFLYREYFGHGGQQSIRVGDWKAVRVKLRRGKIKTELYNLATDPGETTDVAKQHRKVLKKLEALMAEQHVPSELTPLKAID